MRRVNFDAADCHDETAKYGKGTILPKSILVRYGVRVNDGFNEALVVSGPYRRTGQLPLS